MKHIQTYEQFINESQEEMLNEDASTLTSILLLLQSTALLTATMAKAGVELPGVGLSDWWAKWKKDRRVNKILDKLKDDSEIQEFLAMPPKEQEGKWRNLIKTKLNKEEMDLLASISRDRVKRGSV